MPVIKVNTIINAPVEKCFSLSLSVDLHQRSLAYTKEKAIGGVTTGLMKLNDKVKWRARHFGLYFTMTVKITELIEPNYFVDEMINGPFKTIVHRHYFDEMEGKTLMRDEFYFEAPFGPIGQLASHLFLKKYMARLLASRNREIIRTAEQEV